ncbi:MAG TPA: NAD-dependent epimerase/dehydratase family protein [Solirubrobacteraceae bacterium]|nr:NAD-dependent epimerase/dehydratase family protein [Solirubrobacteraceae bacterium]
MRILVTGGAGFIGSHIVDALLAGGHEVRVLDALHPSVHRVAPAYLDPRAELIRGDVSDPAVVARAARGADAVCHQAAKVGLGLEIADISAYVRDNCLGTAVLLAGLAAQDFSGRVVLASSMVVYGEGRYRCPSHGPTAAPPRSAADLAAGRFEPPCPRCGAALEPLAVPEAAAVDPRNIYAATKLHQEHLCFAFSRETGVPVTALRYHNVYGPRMPRDTPYSGVAAIFASALAAGRAPRVFEDGRQLRDFVHVRDVAHANVLALTQAQPAVGAFNVASGTPRSVGEMALALHGADGAAAGVSARPLPVITGEYRLGDVRHVFASTERAACELDFIAREDFLAGIAEFARAPLRQAA